MVPPETITKTEQPLIGSYPASPAGQITEAELAGLKQVPEFDLPQWKQVLNFFNVFFGSLKNVFIFKYYLLTN